MSEILSGRDDVVDQSVDVEIQTQNAVAETKLKINELGTEMIEIAEIDNFINETWDRIDSNKEASEKKSNDIKEEISMLFKEKNRVKLLGKVGHIINDFFKGLFGFSLDKTYHPDELLNQVNDIPTDIDFTAMSDDKIDDLIQGCERKISNESHIFKRLHYISLMSRVKDEKLKREGVVGVNQYEKMTHFLEDGDLLVFGNDGNFWNGILTGKSGSPFAHIGVYHQGHFYHSTMGGSVIKPAGGKKDPMLPYMNKTKPRGCMVLRPSVDIIPKESLGQEAEKTYAQVTYNRTAAYNNLEGKGGGSGNEKSYNCGTFVGSLINAVTGVNSHIDETKDALPGYYASDVPFLKPVYMDWYTGKEFN